MSTKKTTKKLSFDHYYQIEDVYANMDLSGNTLVLTDNCHLIEDLNDPMRLGGKIKRAGGKVMILFHAKSTSHFIMNYLENSLLMSPREFIDDVQYDSLPMISTVVAEFNNKAIVDERDYSIVNQEIASAIEQATRQFNHRGIRFNKVDNVIFEHHGYVKTCEYLALDTILSGAHVKFSRKLNLFTTVNQSYTGRWSWATDEMLARLDKWSTSPLIYTAMAGADTNWVAKVSDRKTWYRNAKKFHVFNSVASLLGSNFNRVDSDFVSESIIKSCISFSYQPCYDIAFSDEPYVGNKRRMLSTNCCIRTKQGKLKKSEPSYGLYVATKQTQKDCVGLQIKNQIINPVATKFGPDMARRAFRRKDAVMKELALSSSFVDYLQTKGK